MFRPLRILILVFSLCSTLASGQDLIDLYKNPGRIAEYDILGQIKDIDSRSLSYYMREDTRPLAPIEMQADLTKLTQSYDLILNIPPESISPENLQQYYFPILITLMEKIYQASQMMISLSDGRTPDFNR